MDSFAWLASLEFFGVKLGLDQTRRLFRELGDPQKKLKFLHIAGSNGKGSTGAMLEAGLRNCGYRTGFYSSPHLVDVCERFRLNGKSVAGERCAEVLEQVRAASQVLLKEGMKVTYFEATTATAALLFRQEQCDFVVWETGMGGRLDATNIITPEVSVITSISLEHKEYLGDTLAKIAFEKSGIIKEGIPVFYGADVPEEAKEVILSKAAQMHTTAQGAPQPPAGEIIFRDGLPLQRFNGLEIPLPGRHQRCNALLASMVLKYLSEKFHFSLQKALDGLKNTSWPARFQVFPHENLLFDGGHNPECAMVLAAALHEIYPGEKFDFIYGSFADKDAELFLRTIAPLAAGFTFVKIESARKSSPPEALQELLRSIAPDIPSVCAELAEALDKKTPRRKVLTGSLHLCGEALALREGTTYVPSSR